MGGSRAQPPPQKWLHRKWCNVQFRALSATVTLPSLFQHTHAHKTILTHTSLRTYAPPHTHTPSPTLTQIHMVTVSSETQHVLARACSNIDFKTNVYTLWFPMQGKRTLERKACLMEEKCSPICLSLRETASQQHCPVMKQPTTGMW